MEKTTEHDIEVGVAGIIPIQGLGVVIQGFDLGFRAEVISLFLHLGTTKKRMIWLSDQRIIRFSVFSHLVFCVFAPGNHGKADDFALWPANHPLFEVFCTTSVRPA